MADMQPRDLRFTAGWPAFFNTNVPDEIQRAYYEATREAYQLADADMIGRSAPTIKYLRGHDIHGHLKDLLYGMSDRYPELHVGVGANSHRGHEYVLHRSGRALISATRTFFRRAPRRANYRLFNASAQRGLFDDGDDNPASAYGYFLLCHGRDKRDGTPMSEPSWVTILHLDPYGIVVPGEIDLHAKFAPVAAVEEPEVAVEAKAMVRLKRAGNE